MRKIKIVLLVCRLLGFNILNWSVSHNWQTKKDQISLFLS